jgi:hypothetical protein
MLLIPMLTLTILRAIVAAMVAGRGRLTDNCLMATLADELRRK